MSPQNRREFIEHSLFSAAAAATAGASTQLLAADKKESDSPNERLRVAVIGVRGRGQSHLGAFMKRKDTEVVAIVDADEAIGQSRGVEKVKKATGKAPKFYSDMRKMMEDKSIDIVTIATPNHWHSLAGIWAVQHGKDVYCEKPVSHNVSEGRRLVQAARKHNKIVQTGTQCRSMKGTIDAVNFVQSGGIGTVKVARGLCYKPRRSIGPRGEYEVPKSVNYDMWLGPAPKAKLTRPKLHYDWHWQWAYGNGDLGNQGIHQMDIARWGLGVEGLGDKVVSYGGRFGYVDAGDTANTQVSIHSFGDKRLVFEVRGLKTNAHHGAKVGVIFHGSKGYVVLTSYTGGAAFDLDGKITKKFSGGGDHFGNFLSAVRSRSKDDLNADIEEGHRSSALCHLGNVSYRLGSTMTFENAEDRLTKDKEALETYGRFTKNLTDNKIDSQKTKVRFGAELTLDGTKEVFTGAMAEKAAPWLSREYRKGFEVPSAKNV
jgi:predicted dehydrogenase